MSHTTFTNGITLTDAVWFNDIDTVAYTYFGNGTNLNTPTQVAVTIGTFSTRVGSPILDSISGALVLKGAGATAQTITGANTVLSGTLTAGGTVTLGANTLALASATVSGTPTWSSNQAITLSTAAQPNITSLGSLTSLSMAGTLTMGANTLALASATVSGQPTWSSTQSMNISGNSATVTTNANLTGGVTSVGNAATVVTNANLTGPITSVGNTTSIASGNTYASPTFTGTVSGTPTWASTQAVNISGSSASTTGNAATATALQTARNINGVSFNGTADITIPVGITLGTEQATTSGTSIDFTGIPSGVKQVTISLVGVSTNGTSPFAIQLGDSGGIEITGYTFHTFTTSTALNTSDLGVTGASFRLNATARVAADLYSGTFILILENASTNTWGLSGSLVSSNGSAARMDIAAGMKATSAVLDRVRFTTIGGTDTFDAGVMNIAYQS